MKIRKIIDQREFFPIFEKTPKTKTTKKGNVTTTTGSKLLLRKEALDYIQELHNKGYRITIFHRNNMLAIISATEDSEFGGREIEYNDNDKFTWTVGV